MCASWDGDDRPIDPDATRRLATGHAYRAERPCQQPRRDLDIPCRICRGRRPQRRARRPGRPGTDHGRRGCGSRSTRPPETSSTKPSTSPRCRLHTSSGWVSARSRKGQWVKATVAPGSVVDDGRIEAERGQPVDDGLQARRRRPAPVAAALVAADLEAPPRRWRRRRRRGAAAAGWPAGTAAARGRARVPRAPGRSGAGADRPRPGRRRAPRAGRPRASARGGDGPC